MTRAWETELVHYDTSTWCPCCLNRPVSASRDLSCFPPAWMRLLGKKKAEGAWDFLCVYEVRIQVPHKQNERAFMPSPLRDILVWARAEPPAVGHQEPT